MNVAYHEAGHAVAAIRRGVGLSRVTIDPTDPFCRSHAVMGELGPHDVLVMICAGAAAEARYLKRAVPMEGTDLEQARLLASLVTHADLDGQETEDVLARCRVAADAEVLLNWNTITKVAAALVRQTTLAGTDVEALVAQGETPMIASDPAAARQQRAARVAQAAEAFAREQRERVAAAAAAATERRPGGGDAGTPERLATVAEVRGVLGGIATSVKNHVTKRLHPLEEQIAKLQARVGVLERRVYMGVWRAQTKYSEGCLVTHDGSLWIARSDSANVRPGSTHSWQLAARRGSDAPRGARVPRADEDKGGHDGPR